MPATIGPFDKIILFICCLLLYLFQPDAAADVVPVLLAVIFSSLLSYFDNAGIKAALAVGFIAVSVFMPELVVFFPLIAFDMVFCKYQLLGLLAVIPASRFFKSVSIRFFFLVMMTMLLSIWIRYRLEAHRKLQERYHELDDKAREMSLQFKKQNSDLIEKQDTELNLATLNERNRIAREIHDNVGHLLSSAILQSGALLTINRDERTGEGLKVLSGTLATAMNSIRESVHDLFDESVDLHLQSEAIIKEFNFCEIFYEYNISGNPPKKLKYTFLSILKEALANIMKHSNATQVFIAFREHPGFYQLIIRDNGKVEKYTTENGLGLRNMSERVRSFNGNINIKTDNGFEIFISIPKEAKEA